MLRSMRDGAKSGLLKYFLLGILVMAAGGLVLTDVGGFFRGGVSNNLVAKGNGIKISTTQFDRNVRRVLARQGMAPQEAYQLGLIHQILNGEIQIRILAREARKLGISVSDETVTKQISKLAEPLATEGVSKSDAIKQILRSQGISEGEFIQAIRQEMGNTLFRNALLTGATGISKEEATALYQFRNEKRDFSGFTLTNAGVKDIELPSEESLQRFYDANKQDFAIAEKRSITIATLKKEMLADKVEIHEDDLRKAYEDNIEAYKKPEQRRLEQAILSTQADAQDVVKKIEAKKDLQSAVKDVTGKTAAYLGENKFEQDGLLEEIAGPVFSAKQGDVVGPVQTALGWHVLVLKEVIKPQTESFESVKKDLRDDLLQTQLMDDLIGAANMMDDQLAGGEELEVVVNELALTTETIKNFNQAGTDSKGKNLFAAYQGDKVQILEAAFDFDAGESSPVLEMADGRFIVVRVDDVEPLRYQPFQEVQEKLKTRWISEQKALTNRGRAVDALNKIKGGASLADVAKEYGASVQTYSDLTRTQQPKAPLTPVATRNIFNSEEDEILQLSIQDGFIIGKVTSTSLPDTDEAEKEIVQIQSETAELLPQEILSQYVNALSEKYNVRVNDNVLRMIYGEPAEG